MMSDEQVLAYTSADAKRHTLDEIQRDTDAEYLKIKRKLVSHTKRSTHSFRYTKHKPSKGVSIIELERMLKNDGFLPTVELKIKDYIPGYRAILGYPAFYHVLHVTVKCNWHQYAD